MDQEKSALIPYIYNVSTKDSILTSQRKVLYSHSHSNLHLTVFDVLITALVIRPTVALLFDSGYSELN